MENWRRHWKVMGRRWKHHCGLLVQRSNQAPNQGVRLGDRGGLATFTSASTRVARPMLFLSPLANVAHGRAVMIPMITLCLEIL